MNVFKTLREIARDARFNVRAPDLRVIGTPRSGTNFCRFVIEDRSDVTVGYNVGWWKHALVPPIMDGDRFRPGAVPTFVMYRSPLEQMVSFYKFAMQNRTAIRTEAGTLAEFLRSPIIMQPFAGHDYWFADPVSYWIQFHWAALSWPAPKRFFDLSVITAQPEWLLDSLSPMLGRSIAIRAGRDPGDAYMGRNSDEGSVGFETGTTVTAQKAQSAQLLADLTQEDRAFILRPETEAIYARLQRAALAPIDQQ